MQVSKKVSYGDSKKTFLKSITNTKFFNNIDIRFDLLTNMPYFYSELTFGVMKSQFQKRPAEYVPQRKFSGMLTSIKEGIFISWRERGAQLF